MAWRTALIITYGRTGSTLLMGLLNKIDGYLIRGENNNCFHSLFKFVKSLEQTRLLQGNSLNAPVNPWFNEFQMPPVTEQLAEIAKISSARYFPIAVCC